MSDNRKDLPSVNSPNFLEKVREAMGTYLGNRGDKLDRGVTLRDLVDSNLIALTPGFLTGSGRIPVAGSGTAVANAYEIDLTPPPTPSGATVSAAISNIFIEHAAPTYTQGHGHARTFVYAATWTSGALPVFTDAVKITEFTGTVFAHPSNPATTWHVWIKWQSKDGVLSTSPAGGTNGLVTTTGQNVATLLTALTGQITQSQLFNSLGARIDLIDGATGLAGSVNARVLAEATARGTAITNEATLRVSGDAQIAATVTALTTTVTNNNTTQTAAVQTESSARANAIAAEASQRTTLASRVTTNEGNISTNTAAITTEQTARANGDSANASSISTLSSQVNHATTGLPAAYAAVQTEASTRASADGTLFAQYTVKVDVNGYVAGYGLASTVINGTPSSEFIIRADNFAIAPVATDNTADDGSPFFYRTTSTTINGVSVPAGAYMKAAFIHDATITNAKIANLAVDNAKIADLSVSKLTAGAIAVGQFIQSTSYVPNTSGWRINADGTAELANAVVRGTVFASSGLIGGNTIDASGLQSSNYVAGSSGWRINSGGSVEFGSGVFRGSLSGSSITGVTGTFSGSLSGANITGATGTFSGNLAAGTVDFASSVGTTVTYLSAGYHVLTVPAGMFRMRLTLYGGGGGGGGGAVRYGGGGGGGNVAAAVSTVVAVSPGNQYGMTIGNGGAGGAIFDYPYNYQYPSAGEQTIVYGIIASAGGARGSILYSENPDGGTQDGYNTYGQNGFGPFGGAGSRQQYVVGGNGGSYGSGGGGGIGTGATNAYQVHPTSGGNGGPGWAVVEYFDPSGVVLKGPFETLKTELRNQGLTLS